MRAEQIELLPSMLATGNLEIRLPAISAVYLLLGKDGRVLYVGSTAKLNRRWHHHDHRVRAEQEGCRLAWVDYSHYPETSVLAFERHLIETLRPPLNDTHIPRIKQPRKGYKQAGIKMALFVSDAELAYVRERVKASGDPNMSAYFRRITGLGPSNLGGARKNAGRKPLQKETPCNPK